MLFYLPEADAVVSTGGLGVGPLDVAALALSQLGPWRAFTLAVKPAKPFAFGTVGAAPVFCLPGNPVSALVAFELLARPGLRRLAGKAPDGHLRVRATADGNFSRRRDGKRHFPGGQASVDVAYPEGVKRSKRDVVALIVLGPHGVIWERCDLRAGLRVLEVA